MNSYVLEVENLTKEYKGFTLKDLTFRLPQGFIMGLIGPNGAGKTTIIKLLMNLIIRNDGDIKIFGNDNLENEVEIKSRIGFVYDNSNYYDHLNMKQLKKIIAPFYKTWNETKFNDLVNKFDLPMNKAIRKFSRGMVMKSSIAFALSHNADLIIMDEPTSGLDPIFRRELLEMLSDIMQDEKKSILFSTHITSDLERIADYITYVNKGELVFSKSKDEILENYGLVKGGNDLLNDANRKMFRGIRKSDFGFEALSDN
ncbi:MAG: ABC transporter ATP-binding protein, partial [bacterium]|nr:ABC transporter ATP-binding protein [bacterium]